MLLRLVCLTGLLALSLSAQIQNARIAGVVIDSSGSVIPSAYVVIVNDRTRATLETETDGEGFYQFPVLQPGNYTLTAEAKGFKKAAITSIEVTVGLSIRQDVALELGAVSDSVTVEANTLTVQTNDATIQRAVTLRDIDTLPQLGRGPIAIAYYQPGVQLGPSPNDPSFARINGQRQGANNNTLDGIDVNDPVTPRLGLTMNANNTDSVAEFRIITNGAKAEYGRNAGGTIELITRSGSNEFHGNLFEYHRNTVLNANNFFNKSSGVELPRPKYIQNQFGGSFGGPVRLPKFNGRDKLFFFYNYQGSRVAQEVVRNRNVLTPEARSGIFRWIVPGGQPSAGSVQSFNIPQNDPRRIGIDKIVAANLVLLPDPNNFDVGDRLNTGGFRFNAPAGNRGDQHTFKSDWNPISTVHAYFRYSWFNTFTPADTLNNAEATFPGRPNGSQGGIRSGYSAGVTWTATPRLINEVVLGMAESSVKFGRVRSEFYAGQPLITANLFTNPIPTGFGSDRNSPVNPQIADNVTLLAGRHTFKAGIRFSRITQYSTSDTNIWPNLTVNQNNGNAAPGSIGPQAPLIASADRLRFDNLYNDLLGRVGSIQTTFYGDLSTFRAGIPRVRNFVFRDWAYYLQDDWRVTTNLTLNLGLRWEFYGAPYERDGLQGSVLQNDAGQVNTVGQIANLTVARRDRWYNNDRNNFAPRFGFAWSPFKDKRTVFRGSLGIFYDRIPGGVTTDPDNAIPGFAESTTLYPNQSAGSDRRASDQLTYPSPPTAPTLTPAADRSFGGINVIYPSLRQPYVVQTNFTIQREIFRNTVLEAGVVSNRGIKLLLDQNVNQTHIYENNFLSDFKELRAFQANGTATSGGNALVRLFGNAPAAITAIGATPVRQGAVGSAANTVDNGSFTRYAPSGLSPYYIRYYPQFTNVWVSTNAGRSYYDSLQLSVRRQTGAVRFAVNYTWSKSLDNISVDGDGNTGPLDSLNLGLMRARSDVDRPHSFSWTASYMLPIGRGKLLGRNIPSWLDRFAGGWEIGWLGAFSSGRAISISSGVLTGPNITNFGPLASNLGALADFSGTDRSIGRAERFGGGVRFFTPEQITLFSVPPPGSTGNSGRNAFRGPGFFNTDLSLVKRFRMSERNSAIFRAEAYNLFNTVNFNPPSVNLQTPQSFGIVSSTPTGGSNQSGARILQGALRFEF